MDTESVATEKTAESGGQRGSLTLERGLRILRVLADHPEGLTVSELAKSLSTHRAGIYRLLVPLVEERLVARAENGRHTLAPGLIELASHVQGQLTQLARPHMQALADEIRATAGLTVRDGDTEAVVVAVVEPRSAAAHLAYRPGIRHPLRGIASGIAILAGNPAIDGEGNEISLARERGWARSIGELVLPGTTGIAAPILPIGRHAEASVNGVWIEPRDEEAVADAVMRCARAIAAELG